MHVSERSEGRMSTIVKTPIWKASKTRMTTMLLMMTRRVRTRARQNQMATRSRTMRLSKTIWMEPPRRSTPEMRRRRSTVKKQDDETEQDNMDGTAEEEYAGDEEE